MSANLPDGWTIVEPRFDRATAKAYEGLFTLGSGYLHVRGSLEEHLAGEPQNVEYDRRPGNVTSEKFRETAAQWGTYVPGVFARHPTLNNQMVNLPWPLGLAPIVDGERLDVTTSHVTEYRRALSLRDAVLRRRVGWTTRSGVNVTMEFERLVSAARPHLIVQRMRMGVDKPCQVELVGGLDADVRTNGCWHFKQTTSSEAGRGSGAVLVVTDAGDQVQVVTRMWLEGSPPGFEDVAPRASERGCEMRIRGDLTPGQMIIVHKRSWIQTSRDPDREQGNWAESRAESFEVLLAEHAAEWDRRWEACDVNIEGDPQSQLAIRTALFHLLRSHVPNDSRVAIDAKGYAGEAYWGRYFWDTEMYLLPFFLYTRPEAARTLAEFRINTLKGAQRNARRYGYDGARYAWESDHLGDECCPNWQYADHEVHVTADVAYGLTHFSTATNDPAFLDGPAARVLVETLVTGCSGFHLQIVRPTVRPDYSV